MRQPYLSPQLHGESMLIPWGALWVLCGPQVQQQKNIKDGCNSSRHQELEKKQYMKTCLGCVHLFIVHIIFVSHCIYLHVDIKASASTWGEPCHPGSSHARSVPGASSKRPQPAFCLQHQEPSREGQWVSAFNPYYSIVIIMYAFFKTLFCYKDWWCFFCSPQHARHSGGDVSRDASSRQAAERCQWCLGFWSALQWHATGLNLPSGYFGC